jgi:transglutaminase-like putative cysteine protease
MMEKSSRYWDWPSAGLLFLLVEVSAVRLAITSWTPDLHIPLVLVLLGIALGLALGLSRFKRRAVIWLVIGYSAILLPWQLTASMDPKESALEHLISLGGRLLLSLQQFSTRRPVGDYLFFVALVSIGYWLIAVTAGYFLTRQGDSPRAVVPAAIAMLVVQIYDPHQAVRLWIPAVFVFLALLLQGRMYYVSNHANWKHGRVLITADAALNLNRQLVTAAAAAVMISWFFPASLKEMKTVSDFLDQATRPIRERLSYAFSAVESPRVVGNNSGDLYGETLGLGLKAVQGNAIVFTVQVNSAEEEPPRYYWRGRVYDHYENGAWTNAPIVTENFAPSAGALEIPHPQARFETELTFTIHSNRQSLFYAPAEPVWFDHGGAIHARLLADDLFEALAWRADPVILAGGSYRVRALTANPSVQDLRAAGEIYPEWITSRYLQIPEAIERELQPLAEEVTRNASTPYDKAAAITDYLRNEIEYQTSVSPPPRGTDPALWVLFEYKRGFCNFSASIETLMLRSIGIPARMAVGFAEGEYDGVTNSYTVRRSDAHAWPEVYFPGIGWVEFEPTGNQFALARPVERTPAGNTALSPASPRPLEEPDAAGPNEPLTEQKKSETADPSTIVFDFGARLIPLSYAALAAALAGAGIFLNRRYSLMERLPLYLAGIYAASGNQPPRWLDRWARWAASTAIERAFETLNWSLRKLGHPQPVHATASERAAMLRRLLPSASDSVDALIQEHETALFTSQPGNPSRARKAGWRIVLETWRSRLQSIA